MTRKKIIFDVSADLHQQIKILAARRNMSMSLWLHRAIHAQLREDTKHDAPTRQ